MVIVTGFDARFRRQVTLPRDIKRTADSGKTSVATPRTRGRSRLDLPSNRRKEVIKKTTRPPRVITPKETTRRESPKFHKRTRKNVVNARHVQTTKPALSLRPILRLTFAGKPYVKPVPQTSTPKRPIHTSRTKGMNRTFQPLKTAIVQPESLNLYYKTLGRGVSAYKTKPQPGKAPDSKGGLKALKGLTDRVHWGIGAILIAIVVVIYLAFFR